MPTIARSGRVPTPNELGATSWITANRGGGIPAAMARPSSRLRTSRCESSVTTTAPVSVEHLALEGAAGERDAEERDDETHHERDRADATDAVSEPPERLDAVGEDLEAEDREQHEAERHRDRGQRHREHVVAGGDQHHRDDPCAVAAFEQVGRRGHAPLYDADVPYQLGIVSVVFGTRTARVGRGAGS